MMSRVGSCWTTAKQRKNVRRLLNPGFITVRHVIVRSLTGVPEPSTSQNSCWTQRDSELSKCSDQMWRCSWPDSSSAVAVFVSVCRHVNALKLLQEVSENGSMNQWFVCRTVTVHCCHHGQKCWYSCTLNLLHKGTFLLSNRRFMSCSRALWHWWCKAGTSVSPSCPRLE